MLRKLLPVAIIAVAVVLSAFLVKTRQGAEQSDTVEPVILVDVIRVSPRDSYIRVNSQGTVQPRTRTTLVSEVSGRVMEVSENFVAGGYFEKGEVLLRLDDQDYRAAVSRAEAALATAESQLAQQRGEAAVAAREWERLSPERREQVQASDLYLRKPQLAEAEAQLASARADLEQARAELARTTITAPYAGIVSSKNTDIGQYVTGGATVAEIFAVDYAEVRLPIPESRIPYLDLPPSVRQYTEVDGAGKTTQGPEVDLFSRIGDREQRWTGRLVRSEGVLDAQTRVLFTVIRVPDPYGVHGDTDPNRTPLRVGTYVSASIRGRLMEDVIVLPRHTLQADNRVWTVDPENTLQSRRVEVATVNGDNVYVTGGLDQGDRVVITRMENPLNGTRVQTNTVPARTLQ